MTMRSRIKTKFICSLLAIILLSCNKAPPQNFNTPQQKSSAATQTSGNLTDEFVWPDKYEATNIPMELVKISKHCYYVQGPPGTPTDNEGFMSNAGVVVTSKGVVVFDALGTPSLGYKLLMRIKAITDKPIIKIITSHYHADHIYGLQVFKELGAEIVAPEGAKEYIASDVAAARLKERRESLFPWVNEDTRIIAPDTYIVKDTTLTQGDVTLKIITLGSTHSQGDMMMQVEPDQVLYSGDLIFENRIPFVAGSNPDTWLARLGELDTSNLKAIVPGHGPMSVQPHQALLFTQGYLEFLHHQMEQAVDNLVSFDEAYNAIDWSMYDKLPAFQANRMNAYFVYLRLEAKSVE